MVSPLPGKYEFRGPSWQDPCERPRRSMRVKGGAGLRRSMRVKGREGLRARPGPGPGPPLLAERGGACGALSCFRKALELQPSWPFSYMCCRSEHAPSDCLAPIYPPCPWQDPCERPRRSMRVKGGAGLRRSMRVKGREGLRARPGPGPPFSLSEEAHVVLSPASARLWSCSPPGHSPCADCAKEGHVADAETCCAHGRRPKIWSASRICVSSFRRGHANLLCIDPILVYVLP
ncbi:hypothetical protein AOLI_G00188080 [Acnodon oligacanthus]